VIRDTDAAVCPPEAAPTLRRALGPFALTMLGISAVIGVGIFVVSGITAAQITGPAITLAFFLASIAVLVVALCYCELAAMMPVAGSSYSYISEAMGRFPAWMVAWAMVLEYLISAAAVASGWSGYFARMAAKAGLPIPTSLTSAPFALSDDLDFSLTGGYGNFPAALFTLAMTWLLALGIRESARFNNVIALMKIGIILVIVGVGILYIDPANWHPFIPPNEGAWGHFGYSGLMRGTAIAVWVYIGFETISTSAQEARNPKRDLTIAMLATMAISTLLYIAMGAVMTGIVPSRELNVPDPILATLDHMGPRLAGLSALVGLFTLFGISATLLATLYGQIRVFYIMAKDGQLPAGFAYVHPRHRTPTTSTWVTGGLCAFLSFALPIDVLADLVSMGTLFAFASVCACVPLLRRKHPDWPRPFRLLWSPVLPALGMLTCLGLMASMPLRSWAQLGIWMCLAPLLYRRRPVKNCEEL